MSKFESTIGDNDTPENRRKRTVIPDSAQPARNQVTCPEEYPRARRFQKLLQEDSAGLRRTGKTLHISEIINPEQEK